MLTINFNPSILKAQNTLNIANKNLNTALQRLSTGVRINSAKDDPAGYYVAQGLNSQIKGLKTAQSNVTLSSSFLNTAQGSLDNMTSMLNRLNDIALQGASNTMTDSARSALIKEADALVEEIKKLNTNTTFNGVNVFGLSDLRKIAPAEAVKEEIPAGYTAIRTVEDLKNINNNLSGKYILMNDIDLSSVANWDPISGASYSSAFKGTFDGNGHVIKNLTSTDNGLFNYTEGATIKNVGLENVNINNSTGNCVGGLAGYTSYDTSISNCYVTGKVTGNDSVGGLAGQLCYGSTVNCCYADCNIKGNREVGGLFGYIYSTEKYISNCYSKGTVTSNGTRVGKFAGVIDSTHNLLNCYTTTVINNNPSINGDDYNYDQNNLVTANDYNRGLIEASYDSGIWDKSTYPPTLKNMPKEAPPPPPKVYNFSNSNTFRLQVGPDSSPDANAMTVDTGIDMSELQVDMSTVESCLESVNCIKAALDAVALRSADIGVSQSRLEVISDTNTTRIENLTAAYTAVTAADEAEEIANYTKAQIMMETAQSLIAQTQAFQVNLIYKMINSLI